MMDVREYSMPRLDNRNAPIIEVFEQPNYESYSGASGDKGQLGNFHLIGHALGAGAGLYYSYAKKVGFWKGFGITMLFIIAGGALGYGIDYATKKDK